MTSTAEARGAAGVAAPLLILEDDEVIARAVQRVVASGGVGVAHCATVADGLALVESDAPLCGALIDLGLPDGDGLDVAVRAREVRPLVPIRILSAMPRRSTELNRAALVGALWSCKPDFQDSLAAFAREVVVVAHVPDIRVRHRVIARVEKCRLSLRETRILALAMHGLRRKESAEACNASENTLKSEIRSLLKKVKTHDSRSAGKHALSSLEDLVKDLTS